MKSLSSVLILSFLLTLGCTKSASVNSQQPVVLVDGEALSAKSFAEKLALEMRGYDAAAAKLPTNVNRAKDDIIHAFMVSVIVKKYARAHNISVTQEEFETEFNKIRKGYANDLAFKASLADSGLLVDEWKDEFKKSLLQKKVFEQIATAQPEKKQDLTAEAKKYYQSHYAQYVKPPEVHLAQIVVAKLEEIEKIQKLLKTYTFADMAKKYSLSPDAAQGGDIGFISKGTVPAFDVAFNMAIGQTSSVVKSSYGYHLLKVLGKKPPTKISFEQARPGIIKTLEDQGKQGQFNTWLIESLKTVKVEKNQALIEKIKVYTQGSYE